MIHTFVPKHLWGAESRSKGKNAPFRRVVGQAWQQAKNETLTIEQ